MDMVLRARRRVAVVVVLVGGLALAGCRDDDAADGTDPAPPTDTAGERTWQAAGGGAVPAFRLSLREGTELAAEPRDAEDGCAAAPAWSAEGDDERSFSVSSLPVSCEIDASVNESPLNGRHPAYRTAEDVPDQVAAGADRVTTALGEALVFSQTYTECTNACTDFSEPFALITLDEPADPAHPALVFTSAHGEVSEDELRSLITEHLRAG
ncbi:hypothetical protein [Streptomyces sp. URMC 129]|uniref:hypothetical protein n=1 Tax=Streptomyces sp. URMC 129 TaxID=3423407 RepID=UPI003F1AF753